jgi:hypothetical protein
MMDKQLASKISEYGLPLVMNEIAQYYTLAGHIKSSCPYPYQDSDNPLDAEWFLLQHDETGTRDLVLAFESECEIRRAGYTFDRRGSNGRSWRDSFSCQDSCVAISLSHPNAWKKRFELPPYEPRFLDNLVEAFRKNAFDQAKYTRDIPLFTRNYSGEHIFSFTRDLLQLIPRYRDMLSKGHKVETLLWNCNASLKVKV